MWESEREIRFRFSFRIWYSGTNRPKWSIEERHGLHAGNFKPLAAAHVLAHQDVILAEHVGSSLGKTRTIALVGAGREASLLGTNQPADLVLRGLMTMWAIEVGWLLVGSFVEEFAFVHRGQSSVDSHRPSAKRSRRDSTFKLLHIFAVGRGACGLGTGSGLD